MGWKSPWVANHHLGEYVCLVHLFVRIEQSQIQVFSKAWDFKIQRLVLRSFIGMSCWKWWIHDRSVGSFHLFTGLRGPTSRDEILQILPYHSLLSTSSVHGTLDANPCSYNLQPITTGVMNFGLFVVKYSLWFTDQFAKLFEPVGRLWTMWEDFEQQNLPKIPAEESLQNDQILRVTGALPALPFRKANLPADGTFSAAASSAGATAQRGARAAGGVQAVQAASKAVPFSCRRGFWMIGTLEVQPLILFRLVYEFHHFWRKGFSHHPIQEPPCFFTMVATTSREKFTYPHGSLSVATVLFSVRGGWHWGGIGMDSQ